MTEVTNITDAIPGHFADAALGIIIPKRIWSLIKDYKGSKVFLTHSARFNRRFINEINAIPELDQVIEFLVYIGKRMMELLCKKDRVTRHVLQSYSLWREKYYASNADLSFYFLRCLMSRWGFFLFTKEDHVDRLQYAKRLRTQSNLIIFFRAQKERWKEKSSGFQKIMCNQLR